MKIGLAYPIDSLSGKAAARSGLVYFLWRGLQVGRRWVIPKNPSTTEQDTIRAYHSASAKGFQTITPAQKVAWHTLALIYGYRVQGGEFVMPEISCYCMVNDWRQIGGQAIADDAPTKKAPFSITAITEAIIVGINFNIGITHSSETPTGNFVAVKMTAPLASAVKVPTDSDYRMITGVSNSACIVPLTASPMTISLLLTDLWTTVAENDYIGISILPLSDAYAPGLELDAVVQVTV